MKNVLGWIAVGAVAVLVWIPRAHAVDGELLLLAQGEAWQQRELGDVRAEVESLLRDAGRGVIANPKAAFELQHSREARGLDAAQLAGWTDELIKWRDRKKPQRVADFASLIVAAASSVPEMTGANASAVGSACFEGLIAYQAMRRLDDAKHIIEFCAGLTWLVTRENNVFDEVRPLLVADGRLYRLTARVVPSNAGHRLWLQGAKWEARTAQLRTLPGTRLAITADCPGTQRVHWVVAGDEPDLSVTIDCSFDRAVHTDARGLWLFSPPELVGEHAAEIARVMEAPSVIVLSRGEGQYQLRSFALGRVSRSVAFPVVHSDRQVAAALTQLLDDSPLATAAGQASVPLAQPSVDDEGKGARSMRWSGAAGVAGGLALTGAGWALYGKRTRLGEALLNQFSASPGRQQAWRDVRTPLLAVAISGAALGAAGAAVLANGMHRPPWWALGALAAAGLGLGAWGVVDLIKGDACRDARACAVEQQRRDRGTLLVASSVPLLVFPLTAAFRLETRRLRRGQVALAVTGAGGLISGQW